MTRRRGHISSSPPRALLGVATITLLAVAGVADLPSAAASGRPTPARVVTTRVAGPPTQITIGALLDLSGDGKALGRASKAALEVAVANIERISRGQVQIELDVRDTHQNPQAAVRAFYRLVASGVRVVIGPQTSGEVRALLEANANGTPAVVVSNGSTASSLAFPDDAVYRLVPDDRVEAAASADLMAAQGQHDVVVTYRVDPGNEGLASSLSDAVRARGGQAVRGPVYPGGTTSFGPAVALLAQKVESLDSEGAVYLAGFGEVADYLAAASAEEGLVQRPFYGGGGSAKSQALVDDRVAAKMAADSGGFPSPLLTVPPRALRDRAHDDQRHRAQERSGCRRVRVGGVRRTGHRRAGAPGRWT